jgi:hypothetical protein
MKSYGLRNNMMKSKTELKHAIEKAKAQQDAMKKLIAAMKEQKKTPAESKQES